MLDIPLLKVGRGAVGVLQFHFQGDPIYHDPHIRKAAFLEPATTPTLFIVATGVNRDFILGVGQWINPNTF
ncbi:hypothetical protein D1641_04110 [Colidextribacter sp. OB.20]|nr:hypothetical protein [Colidextribacter sp. OB.20]